MKSKKKTLTAKSDSNSVGWSCRRCGMSIGLVCKLKAKNHTLTGVIWLIGIVRRLGTQLAGSLCPKPSVPINQMTPAFNIWGLPILNPKCNTSFKNCQCNEV
ncbi:hypothetical protein TYRP_009636 [Tyrophagus putrescentiae]|nr:hypothetical protein TYRP_009636 [Tyrophagus putrescentiae]